jgi:hypothetical protein
MKTEILFMNSLVFNGGNSQQIINLRNATRVRVGLGVFDNTFANPAVSFNNCLDTQIDYVNNISVIALSDASSIAWDLNQGKNATVTLAGTGRTVAMSNPLPGQTYTIDLITLYFDGVYYYGTYGKGFN